MKLKKYKIGDKLNCHNGITGTCDFSANSIYEIATQRQQDGKFVIFDDNNEAEFFDEKQLSFYFALIDDKSLNNGEKTLKNPKAVHYNLWLDTDSIDIIKAKLTEVEYIGALKYNILKYQLRLGKKDCIESDMEKIEDYKRELNSILESKKC